MWANASDTWYKGNTTTIGWDAVTTYEDGTTIPSSDPVSYNIYVKNDKTGTEIFIGNSNNLQIQVVVPSKGWWRFGISSLQLGNYESPKSWSDVALVCLNGEMFGVRNLGPSSPVSLKRVGP